MYITEYKFKNFKEKFINLNNLITFVIICLLVKYL